MVDTGVAVFDGIPLRRWFMARVHLRMLCYLASLREDAERVDMARETLEWEAARVIAVGVPEEMLLFERDFRKRDGPDCPLAAYFRNHALITRHAACARGLTLTLLHGKNKTPLLLPVAVYNWVIVPGTSNHSDYVTNSMLRFVHTFAGCPRVTQACMFSVVARICKLSSTVRAKPRFRAVSDEQAVEQWTDAQWLTRRLRWEDGWHSQEVTSEWFHACVEFVDFIQKRWMIELVYVKRKVRHECQNYEALVYLFKGGPEFLASCLPKRGHLFWGASEELQGVMRHFLAVWVLYVLQEPAMRPHLVLGAVSPQECVHTALMFFYARNVDQSKDY